MKAMYTAIIQQHGRCWIGWIAEIPGVNSQGDTRDGLLANLSSALAEGLEMNRSEAMAAVEGAFEEIAVTPG